MSEGSVKITIQSLSIRSITYIYIYVLENSTKHSPITFLKMLSIQYSVGYYVYFDQQDQLIICLFSLQIYLSIFQTLMPLTLIFLL